MAKLILKAKIRTKILAAFLGLSLISLSWLAYLSLSNIKNMGRYAVTSSTLLGNEAIKDSTASLEELGVEMIKQKAIDVAGQCAVFIKCNPDMKLTDLQGSDYFREIAIQKVGKTGYTALSEYGNLVCVLHSNPKLINFSLNKLSEKLPGFWKIMRATQGGKVSCGYYDWSEPDGSIRKKYMYIAPVAAMTSDGIGMHISATTYIDEFSKPVEETSYKIEKSAIDTGKHIQKQIKKIKSTFILIVATIIIVVLVIAVFLAKMITNPVNKLTEGSKTIGKGDLEYRVNIASGDELEELADSFNKMASDLKNHINELKRTTAEKERLLKELEIAKGIQQSFLPDKSPEIKDMEIAAYNLPAKEVGGDFYDFIQLTEDKWGLVIADVSGKGMPAALFMALSRTLVRASASSNYSASNAISKANNLICEESKSGMFVTLFYAILDVKKRKLTYVNAGHNPPFLFRQSNEDIVALKAKGLVLGAMDNIDLEEVHVDLDNGDIVVLYTDGVTEAINNDEEQFDEKRLLDAVAANKNLPAQDIIKNIVEEVVCFSEGQPQFDDITMMILKNK